MAVMPNAPKVISTSEDGTISVWNFDDDPAPRTLCREETSIDALALASDGRYAISGSSSGLLRIWDLVRMDESKTPKNKGQPIIAVGVESQGRDFISVTNNGDIDVWELTTGIHKTRMTDRVHELVKSAIVSPNGRYVVLAYSVFLPCTLIRDLETDTVEIAPEGFGGRLGAIAFMPDGKRAISASDAARILVWDLQTNAILQILAEYVLPTSVAVASDGRFFACAFNRILQIRSLDTGEVLASSVAENPLTACAITPRSSAVVAGDEQGWVYVWTDINRNRSIIENNISDASTSNNERPANTD